MSALREVVQQLEDILKTSNQYGPFVCLDSPQPFLPVNGPSSIDNGDGIQTQREASPKCDRDVFMSRGLGLVPQGDNDDKVICIEKSEKIETVEGSVNGPASQRSDDIGNGVLNQGAPASQVQEGGTGTAHSPVPSMCEVTPLSDTLLQNGKSIVPNLENGLDGKDEKDKEHERVEVEQPMKRRRGRPRKPIDPNPVQVVKRPVGRPRKPIDPNLVQSIIKRPRRRPRNIPATDVKMGSASVPNDEIDQFCTLPKAIENQDLSGKDLFNNQSRKTQSLSPENIQSIIPCEHAALEKSPVNSSPLNVGEGDRIHQLSRCRPKTPPAKIVKQVNDSMIQERTVKDEDAMSNLSVHDQEQCKKVTDNSYTPEALGSEDEVLELSGCRPKAPLDQTDEQETDQMIQKETAVSEDLNDTEKQMSDEEAVSNLTLYEQEQCKNAIDISNTLELLTGTQANDPRREPLNGEAIDPIILKQKVVSENQSGPGMEMRDEEVLNDQSVHGQKQHKRVADKNVTPEALSLENGLDGNDGKDKIELVQPMTRKRGRPRKPIDPNVVQSIVKRPRGKPRNIPATDEKMGAASVPSDNIDQSCILSKAIESQDSLGKDLSNNHSRKTQNHSPEDVDSTIPIKYAVRERSPVSLSPSNAGEGDGIRQPSRCRPRAPPTKIVEMVVDSMIQERTVRDDDAVSNLSENEQEKCKKVTDNSYTPEALGSGDEVLEPSGCRLKEPLDQTDEQKTDPMNPKQRVVSEDLNASTVMQMKDEEVLNNQSVHGQEQCKKVADISNKPESLLETDAINPKRVEDNISVNASTEFSLTNLFDTTEKSHSSTTVGDPAIVKRRRGPPKKKAFKYRQLTLNSTGNDNQSSIGAEDAVLQPSECSMEAPLHEQEINPIIQKQRVALENKNDTGIPLKDEEVLNSLSVHGQEQRQKVTDISNTPEAIFGAEAINLKNASTSLTDPREEKSYSSKIVADPNNVKRRRGRPKKKPFRCKTLNSREKDNQSNTCPGAENEVIEPSECGPQAPLDQTDPMIQKQTVVSKDQYDTGMQVSDDEEALNNQFLNGQAQCKTVTNSSSPEALGSEDKVIHSSGCRPKAPPDQIDEHETDPLIQIQILGSEDQNDTEKKDPANVKRRRGRPKKKKFKYKKLALNSTVKDNPLNIGTEDTFLQPSECSPKAPLLEQEIDLMIQKQRVALEDQNDTGMQMRDEEVLKDQTVHGKEQHKRVADMNNTPEALPGTGTINPKHVEDTTLNASTKSSLTDLNSIKEKRNLSDTVAEHTNVKRRRGRPKKKTFKYKQLTLNSTGNDNSSITGAADEVLEPSECGPKVPLDQIDEQETDPMIQVVSENGMEMKDDEVLKIESVHGQEQCKKLRDINDTPEVLHVAEAVNTKNVEDNSSLNASTESFLADLNNAKEKSNSSDTVAQHTNVKRRRGRPKKKIFKYKKLTLNSRVTDNPSNIGAKDEVLEPSECGSKASLDQTDPVVQKQTVVSEDQYETGMQMKDVEVQNNQSVNGQEQHNKVTDISNTPGTEAIKPKKGRGRPRKTVLISGTLHKEKEPCLSKTLEATVYCGLSAEPLQKDEDGSMLERNGCKKKPSICIKKLPNKLIEGPLKLDNHSRLAHFCQQAGYEQQAMPLKSTTPLSSGGRVITPYAHDHVQSYVSTSPQRTVKLAYGDQNGQTTKTGHRAGKCLSPIKNHLKHPPFPFNSAKTLNKGKCLIMDRIKKDAALLRGDCFQKKTIRKKFGTASMSQIAKTKSNSQKRGRGRQQPKVVSFTTRVKQQVIKFHPKGPLFISKHLFSTKRKVIKDMSLSTRQFHGSPEKYVPKRRGRPKKCVKQFGSAPAGAKSVGAYLIGTKEFDKKFGNLLTKSVDSDNAFSSNHKSPNGTAEAACIKIARKVGRPRKNPSLAVVNIPKRKVGRPRKTPKPADAVMPESSVGRPLETHPVAPKSLYVRRNMERQRSRPTRLEYKPKEQEKQSQEINDSSLACLVPKSLIKTLTRKRGRPRKHPCEESRPTYPSVPLPITDNIFGGFGFQPSAFDAFAGTPSCDFSLPIEEAVLPGETVAEKNEMPILKSVFAPGRLDGATEESIIGQQFPGDHSMQDELQTDRELPELSCSISVTTLPVMPLPPSVGFEVDTTSTVATRSCEKPVPC